MEITTQNCRDQHVVVNIILNEPAQRKKYHIQRVIQSHLLGNTVVDSNKVTDKEIKEKTACMERE